MKKKILIGSMLVLALLLLMPSIPAIQQKTIKEGFKQDLQEKLEEIVLDDDIKHPLLFKWFVFRWNSIYNRATLLYFFSTRVNYPYGEEVIFPIIYFRSMYLFDTADAISDFWRGISNYYEWGWFEDE